MIKSLIVSIRNYVVYKLAAIVPRRSDVWIFGSYGIFNDNSRYFYEYITSETNIRAIWITDNNKSLLEASLVGEAYHRKSVKGIYYCLISKVYIYTSYVNSINYCCSNGAVLINLWHGIPLKKIEFDIRSKPLVDIFNNASFLTKFTHPEIHNVKQYILSPSEYVSNYSFRSAFKVEERQIINNGYPRISNLISCDKLDMYKDKYIFLYTPTWRDLSNDFIEESGIDFAELNDWLIMNNASFIIKLHANTKLSIDISMFSNIYLVDNSLDSNRLLKTADCLITDYSSIFFDFLYLNKPIIGYIFDIQEYMKGREMYHDIESIKFGFLAKNKNELYDEMSDLVNGVDKYINERKELKIKYWGKEDCNINKNLKDKIMGILKNEV